MQILRDKQSEIGQCRDVYRGPCQVPVQDRGAEAALPHGGADGAEVPRAHAVHSLLGVALGTSVRRCF